MGFDLFDELMAALNDGLEVVLIPQLMTNADKTLKSIRIRVIDHRENETASVSRDISVSKLVNTRSAIATELMVARTKVME